MDVIEEKKVHPVLSTEDREAHPGWAIKFDDGTWLCTTMCCDRVTDAFYATRYESRDSALSELTEAKKEWGSSPPGQPVEAWQSLCESLRVRIAALKTACKVSPNDIFEITLSLENALSYLKDKQ